MAAEKYICLKNTHLLVSAALVGIAGLMYGTAPAVLIPQVFDIQVETVDLANIFRAVMCLYLGMACFWVLGVVRPELWRMATLSNIAFMTCLVAGRLISWAADGAPSSTLVNALAGEFLLALFGAVQWRRYVPGGPGNSRSS